MGLTVEWSQLIAAAVESRVGDIYTAMPGQVQTYDATTQTADILPMVKRPVLLDPDSGETGWEALPIIPNVPVCFPRGGGFMVSWPLNQGDTVLLLVTTFAIGQWRTTGEVSEGGDVSQHHLGSAVAIPTLAPDANAIPPAQAGQNAFIIAGPMVILGDANATDFAALASKVMGNYTKLKNTLASATAPPGGGAVTFGVPFNPDDVTAAKVKIK